MKGFILTNAYSNAGRYQYERILEEFKKFKIDIDIKKNSLDSIYIDKLSVINNLKCDFVVYLDKDKYIAKLLEINNVKLFNNSSAIEICDDKYLTYINLCNKGIYLPKTMSSELCYIDNPNLEDVKKKVMKLFQFPLIIKECYGSFGLQVYKINNIKDLNYYLEKLYKKPYIFQEYIKESEGKDIRAIVIGKKFIAAMLRKNANDFRSNIARGATGEVFQADKNLISLCEKIAQILNLDFCGIDFLISKNGYIVCEVNSNAFFEHFEQITKINIAKKYVEYIIEELKSNN